MGANSATKGLKVVENVERILAIELMNAAQALEFRKPLKPSPYIFDFVGQFRLSVPFMDEDKVMYKEINEAVKFIQNGNFGNFE